MYSSTSGGTKQHFRCASRSLLGQQNLFFSKRLAGGGRGVVLVGWRPGNMVVDADQLRVLPLFLCSSDRYVLRCAAREARIPSGKTQRATVHQLDQSECDSTKSRARRCHEKRWSAQQNMLLKETHSRNEQI